MLTQEQRRALDELMAYVPAVGQASSLPIGQAASLSYKADTLQSLLGVSADEIKLKLAGLLSHKDRLEGVILDLAERNPLDAAFAFVAASAAAFYAAEKDANPKIKTYIDAFYYIGTCASVGYADIFAVTQTGKSIAALVMIVGPSLAARALDRPTQPSRVARAEH